MITDELKIFLESEGYSELKEVKSRGICGIIRMLFTTGLAYGIDEYSLKGRYCYHTAAEAKEALKEWDGEGDPPGNWIKHKGHIEYRNQHYSILDFMD